MGETNGQHTSFWPKVLPIGLTVAHWHHFSPILASIWLKSVAHWSHCCPLVSPTVCIISMDIFLVQSSTFRCTVLLILIGFVLLNGLHCNFISSFGRLDSENEMRHNHVGSKNYNQKHQATNVLSR